MKSKEFATARIEGQSNCLLTPLTSLTSLTPIIRKTMKKIYISPAALTVQLGTVQMMAQSTLTINTESTNTIQSSGDILTKESRDVNLWDEEW